MTSMGERFRAWVVQQRPAGATAVVRNADQVEFSTGLATAQVNLYPYEDDKEIVELRITRALDGQDTFFLHFLLDNMPRAEELFGQMAEALQGQTESLATHVLLCCTSALTTTLFASKMGEIAETLSLSYDFTALPVHDALVPGGDFAAVLLAPQVAFMRDKIAAAHPRAVVFEIPGKIFGSYDAGAALQLVMHALHDAQTETHDRDSASLRAVRDLADDRQVLIITLFSLRDSSRIGYRLYDHGVGTLEGTVRKTKLDYRDVVDLVDTLPARGLDMSTLDAVGIALPGVAYRGVASLPDLVEGDCDLRGILSERLHVPISVDNNCNAAAVGCYVSQQDYENLVFFRHAFGHAAGGFGTVIDGRLLKGRENMAGEPKYFEGLFDYHAYQGHGNALWTAEGLHAITENVCLAATALLSPEAIYLAVDTIDDAEEFRGTLARSLGERYTPPVYLVKDYVERVYLGELSLVLQKLRDPNYHSRGVHL